MKDTRLLDKFNEAKQILCRYDPIEKQFAEILKVSRQSVSNTRSTRILRKKMRDIA